MKNKEEKVKNKRIKNAEKIVKEKDLNGKKGKQQKSFVWFIGTASISVCLLLICQFFFNNAITGKEKFYKNTKINGVDVGGLSVAEAENVVLTQMLDDKKNINIKLKKGKDCWELKGKDFEVLNRIKPSIKKFSEYGRNGNFFQNLKVGKDVENNGKEFNISYTNILANIEDKINQVVLEVEQESLPARLVFQPNEKEVFKVDAGKNRIVVDRNLLYKSIDEKLKDSRNIEIDIPIIEFENEIDIEELKNSVVKRSEFSTNLSKSSTSRKSNVKTALEKFNGLIIEPGQTISFNEITGKRNEENGYQNACIIVNGVYVDGVGGGVCQASTTLYNALLLSDIEVLNVNHHSLPASYVPLSFDAMVSGDYSDLVFKNNLDATIYIKTSVLDDIAKVEIFGPKFADGITIKTRAELVKILPHNGDTIVADKDGQYANKILYKGEYYRLKYPREGYESKGFVQYYKDGELLDEKEVRHDFYSSQNGVVMEGIETPADGMVIPKSDVKIIKPQKLEQKNENTVKNKLLKTNPSEYNP